jgi:Zn-dependent hydrolases, including glyoxylases
MHGDHIGGLIKDDQAVFPNAKLFVAQKEYDYWNSGQNAGAKKVLDAYKNQLEIFEPIDLNNVKIGSASILPLKAYGHTPGHTAFLIHSNGKNLLVWGDLTHAMAVQMPHPEIAVTYDVNPKDAVEYRLNILEFVTKNKIPIAGMHIAYPGMGTVEKDGKGYKFKDLH